MAHIEYEHVDNWLDLALRIDDYFTHYDSYIFRGQADSEWKLEPGLARIINRIYKKSSERKSAIQTHKEQFKENIRGRTTLDLRTISDDELWALGQHFGLLTPLLDWTRSPYVAVFFSLFGPCESGNRALWAIVENDIERLRKNRKGEKNNIHVINPLTHYNERLVNQRGLFVNVPASANLEEWVKEGEDQGWISMYKITYPDSIRNDALSALNNRNINHLSLFPDVYGSSKYANYQLEIEPYLEKARKKSPWDE